MRGSAARRRWIALLLTGMLLASAGVIISLQERPLEIAPGIWLESQGPTWGHSVVLYDQQLAESDGFGIWVYARDAEGTFRLQQYIDTDGSDHTTYLTKHGNGLAVLERSGNVTIYRFAAGGIEPVANFSVGSYPEEFYTIAWNGDYFAAGGPGGDLRVAYAPGLARQRLWSFSMPEGVQEIVPDGSGFVATAGRLYRVNLSAANVTVAPVGSFQGVTAVALSSSGNAVASRSPTNWSVALTDANWSATRSFVLDMMNVTEGNQYVRDLRFFGDFLWAATDYTGLLRIDPSGQVQRASLGRSSTSALDVDGSRFAVVLDEKATYIFRQGNEPSSFPWIVPTLAGAGILILAAISWRRGQRGGVNHEQKRGG